MYQKRINKKGSFDERFENQIWKNFVCWFVKQYHLISYLSIEWKV